MAIANITNNILSDSGVATSSLLTTSAAASTYVPYTGATTNVDLGIYNITAHTIRATGSANNAGQINLRSDAIFSLVNGYGTIGSGTTNQFNFYQTTGAGVFRGAIFSLNSITASATRTFTLPDADGTLALTSSLGAYLPLAGGTLTGALNGTSATFSGADLTVTGASTQPFLRVSRTGTGARSYYWGINGGSTLFLQDETAGATRITLTAANVMTLSSDVIVTGTLNSGALTGTSANFSSTINLYNAGVDTGMLLTDANDFYVGGQTGKGLRLCTNNLGNTRMFISVAGNVGIGTTSPNANFILDINSTKASGASGMRLTTQSTSAGPVFVFNYSGASLTNWAIGAHQAISGALEFVSSNSAGGDPATAGTTRMMIASGGNVLIGTTTDNGNRLNVNGNLRIDNTLSSPGNLIETAGLNVYLRPASGYQVFIDSGNGLTVTGTSGVETQNGGGYKFWNDAQSRWWLMYTYTAASNQLRFNYFGNDVGSINPSSGAYTALSDINKKKDFEYSNIGLNAVMGLKPTFYRMKDDESEGSKELGFIAQEVKEFIPQAYVENGEDAAKFIGLNYNAIVAALVKAIQEQQVQIDKLKNA
jgi:hypothetical protein